MRLYNDTDRATVDYATANASNAAVVTVAADPEEFWAIEFVGWSVDKKPSDVSLTIEDVTNQTVLYKAVMKADDTFNDVITFGSRGLQCEVNASIEITLTGTKMNKDLTVQYS